MSLADIQSMKALKLAKQNSATLAGGTYTNLLGTSSFVSLTGSVGFPTTDNGSQDTNMPVSTSQFPLQKYTVKVTQGHTYLFTVRVKGSTVTNTTFDVLPKYAGTSTNVNGYLAVSGFPKEIVQTSPFAYQQMGVYCTMDQTGNIDFMISLSQPNKDTVWSYSSPMVLDITGYNNAQVQELMSYGYFASTVNKTKNITKWSNKNVLAIGDSLTAALQWQSAVSSYHSCTISTHALGGIAFKDMVDGVTNTNGTISALTMADVTGKDLIILFGGMNERDTTFGTLGDLSPTQDTLFGRIQYAINKIYTLLNQANNLTCKILMVAPHCCGKYGFNDVDGYGIYPAGTGQTLEKLVNNIVTCGNYNNLRVVDLWHKSGVGKNTWSVYMASSTATLVTPISSNPYPNNADQVHFNNTGYAMIGQIIAEEMNLM